MNIPTLDEMRANPEIVVVASVSGGKDSAAMSLYLRSLDVPHIRVFFDTGWEHRLTYDYLRGDLTRKLGKIEEVRPKLQMVELIRSKGMFPSRVIRFCTQELKVKPAKQYIRRLVDKGKTVINAVGIRAGESRSRAGLFEWEWEDDFGCLVWRPLISWSEQDVIDTHKQHGLKPNPLYLMGATRVGCWPCIFARKAEIRLLARDNSERIKEIRDLEQQIGDASQVRHELRGQQLKSRPTYFQARGDGGSTGWPIDEAVTWSETTRGGNQFEMFADDRQGCMRWGMCDTEEKK